MNKSCFYNIIAFSILILSPLFDLSSQQNLLQSIDSLQKENLNSISKTKVVDNTNNIALLYGEINMDSTILYAKHALTLAKEISYREGAADAYHILARANVERGHFKKAIKQYNLAIVRYQKLNDKEKLLQTYRGISYALSYSSNKLACLKYLLVAQEIAEEINDTVSISVVYNNLATTYQQLDNYEKALYYFTKTLKLDSIQQDTLSIATSYSNLCVLNTVNNKTDKAKIYLDKLEQILPSIKNNYQRSYFHLAISGYYIKVEAFDSASYHINVADLLCQKYNYDHIKARVHRKKGELLFAQKKYRSSIEAFTECLELSTKVGITEEFPLIYHQIALSYSELGNYEKAFEAQLNENKYKTAQNNNKVAVLLSEFEEKQKNKIILEKTMLEQNLIQQKEANKTLQLKAKYRFTLIVSLLLILVILLLVWFFYKLRQHNAQLREQHLTIDYQKQQLQENVEKLEESKQNLMKINTSKDKFFSIIAHDLRSPFGSILGLTNELYDNYNNYPDAKRKHILRVVKDGAKTTFSLLDNLLNWARTQSNKINLSKAVYTIGSLIEESIAPLKSAADIKSLSIEYSILEDVTVFADKETTKIVIANLFNNAIKFTPKGGKITLSVRIRDGFVEVSMQDSGIGMSQELVSNLFKLDSDSHRLGTENEKGTGLGLILCSEFVTLNGGKIWVDSKEDIGSTFFFTLPLAQS